MYFVRVRDRVMVAHSFEGELFGPAQRLHGATFVIDVEFRGPELTPEGVLVDIGRAHELLREILSPLDYRNLDELEPFRGRNSTTEAVARHVFDAVSQAIRAGRLGPGSDRLAGLRVEIHESDVARAGYEGSL